MGSDTEQLQEFSLYNLLSQSLPEHHDDIRSLWSDPTVYYLVLFAGESRSDRAILSIGPALTYKKLDEVANIEVEGMKPAGYVYSLYHPKQRGDKVRIKDHASEPFRTSCVPELTGQETLLTPSQLPLNLGNMDPAMIEQIVSNDLREKRKELIKFREALKNLREELIAREQYIMESEEKLSTRAQELFEQEVHLKQYEEDLQARDRRIRQGNLADSF